MQKRFNAYKKTIAVLSLLLVISVSAQETNDYVDVVIDGKPAKLSTKTGKYKFTKGNGDSAVQNIETKTVVGNVNDEIHIVGKGETFYAISKRYGISIANIKELNGLSSNILKVGQELKIGYAENKFLKERKYWVVRKGQTLYRIAKESNTTVSELKNLNNLESNTIKIGDSLILK